MVLYISIYKLLNVESTQTDHDKIIKGIDKKHAAEVERLTNKIKELSKDKAVEMRETRTKYLKEVLFFLVFLVL